MSTNDFTNVAKYFAPSLKETLPVPTVNAVQSDNTDITVETHPIYTYTEIFGGAAS